MQLALGVLLLSEATGICSRGVASAPSVTTPRIHVKLHKPQEVSQLCCELTLGLPQHWTDNPHMDGSQTCVATLIIILISPCAQGLGACFFQLLYLVLAWLSLSLFVTL